MLPFSLTLSMLSALTFATQSAPNSSPELTAFGKILVKDEVTLEEEINAAGYLSRYLSAINEKIPKPAPSDIDWFETEVSSGNSDRFVFALGRPEGCFAAYKKTSEKLIKYLDLIASLDPAKLLQSRSHAFEDRGWLLVLGELSNPINSDILNCPSKFLPNVKKFNPVSTSDTSDGDIAIRVISYMILQKFVLDDARFNGSEIKR